MFVIKPKADQEFCLYTAKLPGLVPFIIDKPLA